MKLRKILAGFLAGAIAMTSMVVTTVTASAEGISTYDDSTFQSGIKCVYSDSSGTGSDSDWGYFKGEYTTWRTMPTTAISEVAFDSTTVGELKELYATISATASITDFSLSENLAEALGEGAPTYTNAFFDIGLCLAETSDGSVLGSIPDSCKGRAKFTALNEEATATIDIVSIAEEYDSYYIRDIQLLPGVEYGTNTIDTTGVEGEKYAIIKYAGAPEITSTPADTTVYEETTIYDTQTKQVILTNGTDYDTSTMSEKAKIIVYFSVGAGVEKDWGSDAKAGCGVGQTCPVVDDAWGDNIATMVSAGENTDSSVSIPLADFSSYDGLAFQTYQTNSYITKITIKDAVASAINITIPENGTVEVNAVKAPAGVTVTLTAIPEANYQVDKFVVTTAGGTAVETTVSTEDTNKATFVMPEEAVTVTATFKAIEYKLTAGTADGGSITFTVGDTAATTAAAGATVTIKDTADKYYKYDSATTDVEATTVTDKAFTMPAKDVTVTPKFVVDTTALKTDIDAAVKSLATVTKAYTYTTADYKAELEKAIAGIDFKGITVDTSALKETKATEEATGSIAGTVTIKAGETAITTLTANVTLDKVPTDPVDVAKEAVKAYLAKVTFDNEFHATNQAKAIVAEVVKAAPTANAEAYFMVKAATEDAAGSVTGTITIIATDSEKEEIIEVNETIAKLPAKVYADNQAALEALKADGDVLIQTATQADGKLKSQRFVQKVTMDDVKKATGVRYDFMRSDGKKCSITGDYQCYYKSVAGVQAGTDEAFLSVTMKNIPKDMIVICEIKLLYN